MKVYYLCHEDKKISLFKVDDFGNLTDIAFSKNKEMLQYLPVGVSSLNDAGNWVKSRGIPTTRQGLQADLQRMGVKSAFELMLMNNGVSLSDHYWLCEVDSGYTWDGVNPYENVFRASGSLGLQDDMAEGSSFIPSAALKGDLRKKWVIGEDGVRYLVKGNYGNTCRQSICEVLASIIHGYQGRFSYASYSFIRVFSDSQIIVGCKCPNFTGVTTEFIPAIDVMMNTKKPNDL